MSNSFNFAPEQFASVQKAQIDSLLALANTTFASAERLAALNLNTARTLLEDSASSARTLFAAKDFQEFIALQTSLAQPAVDKAVVWSRSVYDIGTETREELGKAIDVQVSEASQALNSTLDSLVKNAPAGTDAAVSASVSAIKSALGAASTAYETLSKTAKQVSDYAEANIAATAAPKASKTSKKA
ncbi:MAG TPA: phasin family protein [Rhodocyclaceae bacterium]|nr:phasin family protein [Rhodocyclaceae bacterium]